VNAMSVLTGRDLGTYQPKMGMEEVAAE